MLAISNDEAGLIPLGAKSEAVFELAKFTLWLERRIIEKKTEIAAIEYIDPDKERLALDTSTVQERIENTARSFADGFWKPLHGEWSQRFPILVECQERRHRSRRGRRLSLSRVIGCQESTFQPEIQ